MSKKTENQGFICENCGQKVIPLSDGGCRNHCPECLYSLHIDILPGDIDCECRGLMKPETIVYNFELVLKIMSEI